MRARVLGPLELERDGRGVRVPRGQVGKLLRVMLVRADELVSASDLVARLWPELADDDQELGQRRLYVAMSRLRSFLTDSTGAPSLTVEQVGGGYRLKADEELLDAVAFRSMAESALKEGNLDLARSALEMWRGDPYEGFEWSDLVRERRAELIRLRDALMLLESGEPAEGRPVEALQRVRYAPPHLAGPSVVIRNRLLRRLPKAGEVPLVALVAPAGYGKSILLTQWKDRQEGAVAWLNLDEGDDDPSRFWSGVVEAVSQAGLPVVDGGSAGTGSLEFVEKAAHALDTADFPVAIVLEDFHVIGNAVVAQQVEAFVSALRSPVTVVVTSRSPLPFSVARLRAAGQIQTLDAQDLRLTVAEIRRLLGPDDAEWAEAIWQLTEGWPVAVRMLVALPESERAHALTTAMGEYVFEEVVDTLPDEIRRFLLKVAHLDSFSSALAAAVCDEESAYETVEWLVERQLCTVADVGGSRAWVRLHPLLQTALRSRAEFDDSIDVGLHQRRAARWFHEQGATEEALRAAVAGKDGDIVAATVSDVLVDNALEQRAFSCARWLTVLDPAHVVGDRRAFAVTVCIAAVWAREDVRDKWVRARIRHGDGDGDLVLVFVRAFDALRGGRATESVELFQEVINGAADYASDFAPDLVPLVMGFSFASSVEARMYQGTLRHDDPTFAEALALVRSFAPGVAAWIHAWWALVAYVDGATELASTMAEEHYHLRRKGETDRVTTRDNSVVGALTSARRTNDPIRLRRIADEMEEVVAIHDRLGGSTGGALARLLAAAIYRKSGDLAAAKRHQEHADRLILTFPDAPFLSRFAESIDGILRSDAPGDLLALLTDKEREVLTHLATDRSTKQIARDLFVSPNTVRNHISSIYRKLGVKTRHQAVLRVGVDNLSLPENG